MRLIRIALIAILPAVTGQASAQTISQQTPANVQQALKPYVQVKTVAGEERTVRVFFSPSCSFSRQYYLFFQNLARTLPKEVTFRISPVVNKRDGTAYALAYAAVERYYPNYLNNFIEASFIGVQERGIASGNWYGIEKIGRAARIPESVPLLVKKHLADVEALAYQYVTLRHDYQITNTPSVAVAGTYIVNPEIVEGDSEQFSQLVNAVISMAM